MADRRAKLKTRSLERGKSAPLIVVTQSEDGKSSTKKDPAIAALMAGHEFKKRSFYRPTYCQHCSELLWGLMNQGYQCTVCNYVSHEKCMSLVMVDCLHLKAENVVEHVPHSWVGPESKKKKKWCNVCRKKINGSVFYCSVCHIYSHNRCLDDSFNDCKRCALYSRISNPKFPHHWVEGNLPSSAKCEVCLKSCSSDVCLFGFKCGWCGISVHSNCLDTYTINPRNGRCTFRDMKCMVLPPVTVSMLVKEVEQGDEVTVADDDMTSLFSPTSSEDHILEEDSDARGRAVIIIDGSGGSTGYKKWRKRTIQSTYITKKMCGEELLRVSLRKFGISACPDDFSLFELIDASTGDKRVLEPHEIPYNLQQSYNGPLKLYIRKRETQTCPEQQQLKVYNSHLSSGIPFVECAIDGKMTFADLIVKCIEQFELTDKSIDSYCVYEHSPDLCEISVDLAEKPFKRIQDLTKSSLWAHSSLRYYLSLKEETVIELHLWKVPPEHLKSSEAAKEYVRGFIEDLVFEIGPLFPNQGGLIVRVFALQDVQRLTTCHKHVKPLPKIHSENLQINQEPLLVFVNTKSGGKQGVELISAFKRHLNPYQVYDLLNGGPTPGLYAFRNVPKYRVLVAGGDGTVGWVLGALDDVRSLVQLPNPPCALVPLGTGNDLARALNWGSGYTGEKVMQLLYSVEDADVVPFDRWAIDFIDPLDGMIEEGSSESRRIFMNNYLGIGLDAEIALDFHQAREENPEKFNSRLHNKGVYLQLGVQKTFSRDTTADLLSQIIVEVDQKELQLPSGLKGLVLLNIPSWGGGAEPWGSTEDQEFGKCSYNDGKFELVGISGPVHMGQVLSGIRSGIRIAQGKEVEITVNSTLPVQVDGEAWAQTPTRIRVSKLEHQTSMLVRSNREHYGRGMTQTEAKSLIDKQVIAGHGAAPFSSRRAHVLNPQQSQPSMSGASTHTLYIKDKQEQ